MNNKEFALAVENHECVLQLVTNTVQGGRVLTIAPVITSQHMKS